MSKFERHLGKPLKLELENENGEKDVFMIKPLIFQYMPDYYEAMKVMGKLTTKLSDDLSDEEQVNEMMRLINLLEKEDFEKLKFVVIKTLEISYPDESKEEREAFGFKYMFEILNVILVVNSNGQTKRQDTKA